MRIRRPETSIRTERIFFHVREKEKERLKKQIPSIVRKKGIDKTIAAVKKAKLELARLEKKLKQQLEAAGLNQVRRYLRNTDTYREEFAVSEHAHIVPERIVKKLQAAQALYDVSKKDEAQKLCDEVIKEYKIGDAR